MPFVAVERFGGHLCPTLCEATTNSCSYLLPPVFACLLARDRSYFFASRVRHKLPVQRCSVKTSLRRASELTPAVGFSIWRPRALMATMCYTATGDSAQGQSKRGSICFPLFFFLLSLRERESRNYVLHATSGTEYTLCCVPPLLQSICDPLYACAERSQETTLLRRTYSVDGPNCCYTSLVQTSISP